MIHAVGAANQHLYARQLDQMFRMRHVFYVEGHGWDGLTSRDGKETDEFDDENAIYLMSVDPFGDVAASVRLNPTAGSTLLQKFHDWSDEPIPKLESVWDISRWIAAPKHRRSDNPRWPSNHQRELMVGILEFCQTRGLTHLVMLAELRLAERIAAYGWPLRYLGKPREYEGGKGTAVAAEFEVGQHVLALTRAKTGVMGSVLIEIDPFRVASKGPLASAVSPSPELRDVVAEIGADKIRALVRAVAHDLAGAEVEDRARAIELIGAFNRLLETAACGLEDLEDDRERGAGGETSSAPAEWRASR
ncbi:MAG: acyl-homoserine-lactone synthase [Hyphomonadaceae bacterium]|nr:acyl-homoserine-lactone synthase [Hyphomonadaceae bacterium]